MKLHALQESLEFVTKLKSVIKSADAKVGKCLVADGNREFDLYKKEYSCWTHQTSGISFEVQATAI